MPESQSARRTITRQLGGGKEKQGAADPFVAAGDRFAPTIPPLTNHLTLSVMAHGRDCDKLRRLLPVQERLS
jgi:hypothetical protein